MIFMRKDLIYAEIVTSCLAAHAMSADAMFRSGQLHGIHHVPKRNGEIIWEDFLIWKENISEAGSVLSF